MRGRPTGLVRRIDQEAAITLTFSGLLPTVGLLGGSAAHQDSTVVAGAGSLIGGLPATVDLPGPLDVGDVVGGFVGGQIVEAVSGLLRALSEDFLAQLAAPVATYVLSTPDLLAEPTLRSFWLIALAALFACAGLLVAIAGVAIIPGHTRLAHSARAAVAVRLPACLLTAVVSLPLIALEVGLANRLVAAFIGTGFPAGTNPLWTTLKAAVTGDAVAGLGLLVTGTVGVLLLVALVLIGLARWATLWLLIVLAPVVLGFAILPGGEGLVRLWWRLQLATVFLPVANAVLLGTYIAMFSSQRSGMVGALAGVAVLALMAKLPSWVAGAAVGVDGAELSQRIRRGSRTTQRVVTTVAATTSAGTSTAAVAATRVGGSGVSATAARAAGSGGRPGATAARSGSMRVPREVPRDDGRPAT